MKGAITSTLIRALVLALLLLLVPAAILADSTPASSAPPPVAQPLIREGTLAVELAAALNPDFSTNDEAAAESWLGEKGISPANGWIADYPVTPVIMGELQAALGRAADDRRIPFSRDEALKRLAAITSELAIVSPPSGEAPAETQVLTGDELVDPGAVYNYYAAEGPPVVTYYAPPADYYYLYSWVPYPFWWGGFSFGGFFILNDFHRSVFHARHHHHGRFHGDRAFVSNHFRDRATNRFVRVDPGVRSTVRFSRGTDGFGRNSEVRSGMPGTIRSGIPGRSISDRAQSAPSAFRSGSIRTSTFQGMRGRPDGTFVSRQNRGSGVAASFAVQQRGSMPARSFSSATRGPLSSATVTSFSSSGRNFNSGRSFSSPTRSFGTSASVSSFRGGGGGFSRQSSGGFGGGFSNRGGGGFSGRGGGGFSGGGHGRR